ncbi:MAG: exo-alpha-sialidase [Spirochaetaceae bacterium]|nr:MAG: exo-alpha-sialidase [Spirochaetaceae bacterium]
MTANTTYLDPARIITDPGAEYRAAARAFQGIPSLACGDDGRLWSVWYGGPTPGEDENNYVVLAVSTDAGRSWSDERLVIDHADPVVRCFDPEVWRAPDGRIWVFWAQHAADNRFEGSRSGVWAITTTESAGGEATWSEPRRLCDGVMMCKPLVLSDGDWALPVSFWHRRQAGSAAIVVSSDSGATWTERGAVDVPPEIRDHDEHMIVERRDGSLCTWVRTRDGIGESISRDGGRTWSALKSASVPHVRSRFFVRRLRSGRLLLVRHNPSNAEFANERSRGTRSDLTAYLSDDDGATWSGGLLLDERKGVSYPDGDEADDGTIYVTYDFDRRGAREILMAALREEDVLSGDSAAGSLKTRVVINSAGADSRGFRVTPEDIPNRGIVFVDHQKHGRSGHGGNCLTQCRNGDILAFYSNVSGDLHKGHGTFGWSEYKRSTDGGKTWGEPVELAYSRRMYDSAEVGSALVFAATTAPDGKVVAFVCRFAEEGLWVKQEPPVVLLSHDDGRTWSEPHPLDPGASVEDVSLTFDAVFVRDGKIYIGFMGGSANYCPGPYSLYVSEDNGASFERRSELPFDAENYYVTAGVLDDGKIIVYSYPYRKGSAEINERDIPYVTSSDDGRTWSDVRTTRFAKRIRNMQMSEKIGDLYFLHGRSGSMGPAGEKGHLVLYCSRDGINWDDGLILYRKERGGGDCYSANTVVTSPRDGSRRLLIQSSIAYEADNSRVNEHHWWVTP